jgi:hypothetical protein
MYPKLKDVDAALYGVQNKWFYHLLHELSYGSDFISVELFFRGFLILAFVKVVGKDAILPMACFIARFIWETSWRMYQLLFRRPYTRHCCL